MAAGNLLTGLIFFFIIIYKVISGSKNFSTGIAILWKTNKIFGDGLLEEVVVELVAGFRYGETSAILV